MKKRTILIASALLLASSAFAEEPATTHFKVYGFIRNYFALDTRNSSAGTEDLYYYMPLDEKIVDGEDVNAVPSFRFAALTTRVGLDVTGYEIQGYKVGAKIETDFYAGLTGTTGTATLRLRQAYLTLGKGGRSWKFGQAWHPMAADMPDIFSLETGVPFQPFSRTPQITFDTKLSDHVSLTASALWQMQYTSTGPSYNSSTKKYEAKASADYIKYGCTPEFYLGLNFKGDKGLMRVGADVLSIKPRQYDGATGKVVSDRITTFSVYEYGQLQAGNFTLKEKAVFAEDGSHMNMIGGYGASSINSDGSWEFSATRNLSAWASAAYKKKGSNWVPSILFGYTKMFGTADDIENGLFWFKNNASTVNQMFRIQPEILYNLGKVSFGLEYMATAVEYGKASGNRYVVDTDLHWILNNRVQAMVKYTF